MNSQQWLRPDGEPNAEVTGKPEELISLLVLMASHNRKSFTKAAISALDTACRKALVDYHVVLADAASGDGTVKEVTQSFQKVTVLELANDSYWAESMRVAWVEGQKIHHTHELWLNDDVVLFEDAIGDLLGAIRQEFNQALISGATRDIGNGEITYGGLRRGPPGRRLSLKSVVPNGTVQQIDFANGNILLCPAALARKLGGFPTQFRHSMADIFFTGTAAKKGFRVLLAPRAAGTCAKNLLDKQWVREVQPLSTRLNLLRHPKGLPPNEWLRICLRFGGVSGLLYWIRPLLLTIFPSARPSRTAKEK